MDPTLIDLTKKVQTVLDLRKMDGVKAQVCLAIDYSGSMDTLYRNGTVEKAIGRVSAVAVKFDDNQELDVLVFDDGVREADAATPSNFGAYVKNCILNKGWRMGGTNYSPFIRTVVQNYFTQQTITGIQEYTEQVEKTSPGIFGAIKDLFCGKEKETVTKTRQTTQAVQSDMSASGLPIFVIIITDGENFDKPETTALLQALQKKNVYWQFVGVGYESFNYLTNLADKLPNVGFFKLENLETVKDMELYKQLVSEEFAAWVKKF